LKHQHILLEKNYTQYIDWETQDYHCHDANIWTENKFQE